MLKLFNLSNIIRVSGFTLIELLVVIAILGILVSGLMVAINPAEKIRQASDVKVIKDFGAIARAAEAYSASNSGNYPATTDYATFTGGLVTAGEIKVAPSQPSGYNVYRIAADGSGFLMAGELKSTTKYGGACAAGNYKVLRYRSTNGSTCYGCVTAVDITTAVNSVSASIPATCTAF